MNASISSKELDNRWAAITVVCGISAYLAYLGVLAAGHADRYAIALSFVFAFGIAVSSIGLYFVYRGPEGSPLLLIAALANVTATAILLAMLSVQLAVRVLVPEPDVAVKAVWLGLDVAWDLYLGAGTILFALSLIGWRGRGVWLGVPGVLVGAVLLIFNIATFPIPPENAGLVDAGPLVGLWYLVVYVRLGITSVLQLRQKRRLTAAVPA